jgi:hypothetical protein
MSQQKFFGDMTIDDLDGALANKAAAYDRIDVDLRSPTKMNVIPFFFTPCDESMGGTCQVGTITAPTSMIIYLVQEALQEQLVSQFPDAKVPQTAAYDCDTSAYMTVYNGMMRPSTSKIPPNWPLDSYCLRELLDRSPTLFANIQSLASNNGIPYTGYSILLPDDATSLKFFPADVPANCKDTGITTLSKSGTGWGKVAIAGIVVAAVLGATYAFSQSRKSAKSAKGNPSFPERFSLAQLKKMKTLHHGQFDNLKKQTKTYRVWLSRMTKADGAPYNNQVTVEYLDNGSWKPAYTYQAR